MIRFFYERVVLARKKNLFYWRFLYKVNKAIVNLVYPMTQRGNKQCGTDPQGNMIVSLTTYPARIHEVWKTISTLMNQTRKPKRIILWLAESQFPDHQLPESILRLEKRGLEIQYCEDLRPHKKYFEAMKRYPEDIVVTADDDMFYPENHLEKLWRVHEDYPDAVLCQWSHKITFTKEGQFIPYNDWPDNGREEPSYATLAVGCGGILYPPGALHEEAFHTELIRGEILNVDDLWLKCMEILNGIKAMNCNETVLGYFSVLSIGKAGLWLSNTGEEHHNDHVWESLMKRYPLVRERLWQEYNEEQL